jgi:hypothetical protein
VLRCNDALLLAWGGVCPEGWVYAGDPQRVAEQIRERGDWLQTKLAATRATLQATQEALGRAVDEANRIIATSDNCIANSKGDKQWGHRQARYAASMIRDTILAALPAHDRQANAEGAERE